MEEKRCARLEDGAEQENDAALKDGAKLKEKRQANASKS
jgi:hypothetical protein